MMLKMDAQKSAGGGGSEFKAANYVTTTNITGEWDFDADCLLLMFVAAGYTHILLADLSSNNLWIASSVGAWAQNTWSGINWSITKDKRSFNIISNGATTNACYVPIKGKPTGYFS